MSRKSFLEDITKWAISKGLPKGGIPGFWLGFTRETPAPLNADNSLSDENRAIRKTRGLFEYRPKGYKVAAELWRNGKQPGDATDERDERCTAQKKPGLKKFIGIDDYACEGYQNHYAVCMYY